MFNNYQSVIQYLEKSGKENLLPYAHKILEYENQELLFEQIQYLIEMNNYSHDHYDRIIEEYIPCFIFASKYVKMDKVESLKESLPYLSYHLTQKAQNYLRVLGKIVSISKPKNIMLFTDILYAFESYESIVNYSISFDSQEEMLLESDLETIFINSFKVDFENAIMVTHQIFNGIAKWGDTVKRMFLYKSYYKTFFDMEVKMVSYINETSISPHTGFDVKDGEEFLGYEIKIPKSVGDLRHIGKELKICTGLRSRNVLAGNEMNRISFWKGDKVCLVATTALLFHDDLKRILVDKNYDFLYDEDGEYQKGNIFSTQFLIGKEHRGPQNEEEVIKWINFFRAKVILT